MGAFSTSQRRSSPAWSNTASSGSSMSPVSSTFPWADSSSITRELLSSLSVYSDMGASTLSVAPASPREITPPAKCTGLVRIRISTPWSRAITAAMVWTSSLTQGFRS